MNIPDLKNFKIKNLKLNKEELLFRLEELKKNRINLGGLLIIISLFLCFIITPLFNSNLKKQAEIVVITKNIDKGTLITDSMIEIRKVGAYNLSNNIIHKKEQAINKYASVDILKDTYLLKSMLVNTPTLQNASLNDLKGDKRAISFTIKSFAEGLSGKIEAGDIISIISKKENNSEIYEELQFLLVASITTEYGKDFDAQNEKEEDMPKTITVICSKEQAIKIAELEQQEGLYITLVYRGDKDKRQLFLDYQDEKLNELYADKRQAEAEYYLSQKLEELESAEYFSIEEQEKEHKESYNNLIKETKKISSQSELSEEELIESQLNELIAESERAKIGEAIIESMEIDDDTLNKYITNKENN